MILLHFQLFSAFQLEFTSNIQTYACSIYMDCPTFLCAFSRFLRDAIPIFLCGYVECNWANSIDQSDCLL